MNKRLLVKILVAVIVLVSMVLIYFGIKSDRIDTPSNQYGTPLVFSNDRMLLELWGRYKQNILEPQSLRALDRDQGNITTSEGQSYTMMRAAWMDDKATFDQVWKWTKDNMQRDDKLISWRFGQMADGNYGIQTDQGGQNTATDADVDIAYSLIMASNRWKDDSYIYDAKAMVQSIWDKEVVSIGNKPVLAANDIERLNPTSIIVNPSYFSPYAYRVFAKLDPAHDWQGLVDNSYSLLFAVADSTLNTTRSAGLTPDWVRVNRTTGAVSAHETLDTNYGYDAFRTPWRLALDYTYNKDVRAKQVLSKYTTLSDAWQKDKKLSAVYGHDGTVVSADSVPASYGASLGYFIVNKPEQAKQVYEQKLLTYYNPDTQGWKYTLSYYDDNWAWFGIALYLNQLPDIAGSYGS